MAVQSIWSHASHQAEYIDFDDLLGDETVNIFEWVFNTFKIYMGCDGPRVMLTDQDPAMTITLGGVFPNTIHRLCLWHVQKQLHENNTLVRLYEIRKD